VFVYTLILVPFTLAPWALGLMGWIYGLTAASLGAVFIWYAWRVLTDKQDANGISLTKDKPAKAAFKYSILYLFILFGACAVDRLL
jgi:protoheme IX farnesyltransferase